MSILFPANAQTEKRLMPILGASNTEKQQGSKSIQ
jgi:hypothetical protein